MLTLYTELLQNLVAFEANWAKTSKKVGFSQSFSSLILIQKIAKLHGKQRKPLSLLFNCFCQESKRFLEWPIVKV